MLMGTLLEPRGKRPPAAPARRCCDLRRNMVDFRSVRTYSIVKRLGGHHASERSHREQRVHADLRKHDIEVEAAPAGVPSAVVAAIVGDATQRAYSPPPAQIHAHDATDLHNPGGRASIHVPHTVL